MPYIFNFLYPRLCVYVSKTIDPDTLFECKTGCKVNHLVFIDIDINQPITINTTINTGLSVRSTSRSAAGLCLFSF